MSSAIPRNKDMPACVCVLIRPGATRASGRSMRRTGCQARSMSERGPTATMRSPRTATAPFWMRRRSADIVTTYLPLITKSQGAANAAAPIKNSRLQERSIKGPREQGTETHGLRLTGQIREDDFNIAAEFPKNLAAGAARRRKFIGIGHHRDPAEPSLAFRDRLEDRHPLRADRQPVSGVLDVTPGVNMSFLVLERRADAKFRIRRMRVSANVNGGGDQGIGHRS